MRKYARALVPQLRRGDGSGLRIFRPRPAQRATVAALIALLATGCTSVDGKPFDDNNGDGDDGSLNQGDSQSGGDTIDANDNGATVTDDDRPLDITGDLSSNIVVDQFGYLPNAKAKVAIVRNPQSGFDSANTYTPGSTYQVIDAHTGESVFQGSLTAWNGGDTDSVSGDKVWWFDFSSVTAPGTYFVLDVQMNKRSDVFDIADTVYRDVLKQAMRMFFYQRDGFAKDAAFAGAPYADAAAHMGDTSCKLWNDTGSAKDVHGGWFDAGDYNKYTNWSASYVINLMRAFEEKPSAWRDDYNIPESGNKIPDVLDETRFELEWIRRMQNSDGSVNSIVSHNSDYQTNGCQKADITPSQSTCPCKMGAVSTSAALSTAAAFAMAAITYKGIDDRYGADATSSDYGFDSGSDAFADDLAARAETSWTWASANSNITFRNTDNGLQAGEQEVDDAGRAVKKLIAAVYLYKLTSKTTYRDYVDDHYTDAQMMDGYPFMWQQEENDAVLAYSMLEGATQSVKNSIRDTWEAGVMNGDGLGAYSSNKHAYRAYIQQYVWGSNQNVADQGALYYSGNIYDIGTDDDKSLGATAAEDLIHYFHGVNPINKVYLTSMQDYGAATYVEEFYHSWFSYGSRWQNAQSTQYGPPPGFLPGGANPNYTQSVTPPAGQPPEKSYADISNGDDSVKAYEITEPSDGYQERYVRILSKFVQ